MRAKHFFEYLFITLFALIVSFWAVTTIYRSIVHSKWYETTRREKEFHECVNKLNSKDSIIYIEYYEASANVSKQFYDVDEALFADISCNDYTKKLGEMDRHKVTSSDRVSVFFEDGSLIDFYVTDNLKVYLWGTIEIKAGHLVTWYSEIHE